MVATVRTYRSDDASAPVLSGTAGAFINLLDKCLVAGYGSATPAGWTKPYTGTNLAAFRTGAGAGQRYLRVTDTSAQEARLVGYETMSAISTGTNLWPTAVQFSGGLYAQKSLTADATARPWLMLACERAFYLFIACNGTAYGNSDPNDQQVFFGDVPSFKTGDQFGSLLIASTTGAGGGGASQLGNVQAYGVAAFSGAIAAHYMPRSYLQTGTAIGISKSIIGPAMSQLGAGGGTLYPDPVTGGLRLARVVITESASAGANYNERGLMPGLWAPLHSAPAALFDTFTGTGDLASKNFVMVPAHSSGSAGRAAIETNGSWGL